MNQRLHARHESDASGAPAGGRTTGTGIDIRWQNGPLGRHADGCRQDPAPGMEHRFTCVPGCTRRDPNGAFVEGVIGAARDRLGYYQATRFACPENQAAIEHLDLALEALQGRTASREAQKVEGTHEIHEPEGDFDADDADGEGGEPVAKPRGKGRARSRS